MLLTSGRILSHLRRARDAHNVRIAEVKGNVIKGILA